MTEERKAQATTTLVVDLSIEDLRLLHAKARADRRTVDQYAAIVLEREARRPIRRKPESQVA